MSETPQEQHAKGLKTSIESIIGANTVLKRRKKTEDDKQREMFENVILSLEKINVRSEIIGTELDIDLSKYNDGFYNIIDSLLSMTFDKESIELIFFYIYDRILPNGEIQELIDLNGNHIILDNPTDLWNLIQCIKEEKKKK
jgi:hypothetical protein